MNADELIKEAKKRLAEIESEAAKLRALIAAAEGKVPAPPAPSLLPFIPVMPQPVPYVPYHLWEIDRRWDLGQVYCGTPNPQDTITFADTLADMPTAVLSLQ